MTSRPSHSSSSARSRPRARVADRTGALRRARLLLALAAALGAALAATLLLPGLARAQGVGLQVGTDAPDVELEDLDGNPVRLGEYVGNGTPALLEFWATWCENCEMLQPQLDRIHAEHGDRINIVAVAVAVSQSQRRVRRHVEDHGAGYPYLWDGSGAAVRAYNAATTSIVLLVDGEGRVVYSGVGGDQDLVGEVERLLASDG